jgi:hypothetical protein
MGWSIPSVLIVRVGWWGGRCGAGADVGDVIVFVWRRPPGHRVVIV